MTGTRTARAALTVEQSLARLAGRRVGDIMVTIPKTVPAHATVGELRAAFADDHVHMLLLAEAGILRGTLVRGDLHGGLPDAAPALRAAVLAGRTVAAGEAADAVFLRLRRTGQRRLAVVDPHGRLLGLVCLKRRLDGFCSDADVLARACGR